jgi:hypothetical protein
MPSALTSPHWEAAAATTSPARNAQKAFLEHFPRVERFVFFISQVKQTQKLSRFVSQKPEPLVKSSVWKILEFCSFHPFQAFHRFTRFTRFTPRDD